MNKKNIGAVLLKGAPKQRAKLLAEEIARATYNLDSLLSETEFFNLQDSFKTSSEIKLYNKYRKNSRVLVDSIANLQAIKFEILMRYSDLRGWIVYWETIQQTELSINISLASIDNESKKYATAKEVALKIDYPFIQSTIDEENYISLLSKFDINTLINKEGKLTAVKNKDKIDKSNSLYSLLEEIKTDTNKTLIRFLSWRRATLDFMEVEEFNIKTFKDVIEDINRLYNPKSIIVETPIKFNSDVDWGSSMDRYFSGYKESGYSKIDFRDIKISNMYSVGIGKEIPTTTLDVADSSVNDILTVVKEMSNIFGLLNRVLASSIFLKS